MSLVLAQQCLSGVVSFDPFVGYKFNSPGWIHNKLEEQYTRIKFITTRYQNLSANEVECSSVTVSWLMYSCLCECA